MGITTDTASCAIPLLSACTVTSEAPAREAKNNLPSSKTFLTASASLTTNIAAFLPGATFICVRILRIPRTASLISSMAFSSVLYAFSSVYAGQLEIIMDSSSLWIVQKISSVIKGIYGCSSFSASISTCFNVHSAAFLL